ncbi:hypothetical protein QBC39DRAFT_429452 [Podospora conica]|nr:hypothetical protein QBC39DRAFT_429452 [Schizothecium conicum]
MGGERGRGAGSAGRRLGPRAKWAPSSLPKIAARRSVLGKMQHLPSTARRRAAAAAIDDSIIDPQLLNSMLSIAAEQLHLSEPSASYAPEKGVEKTPPSRTPSPPPKPTITQRRSALLIRTTIQLSGAFVKNFKSDDTLKDIVDICQEIYAAVLLEKVTKAFNGENTKSSTAQYYYKLINTVRYLRRSYANPKVEPKAKDDLLTYYKTAPTYPNYANKKVDTKAILDSITLPPPPLASDDEAVAKEEEEEVTDEAVTTTAAALAAEKERKK